jgi:F-type H+-transporting ATPase subunit O
VRQFSTATAVRAKVTPPIYIFGIEGRYAHALYSAASKEKKLDLVEKDLKDIRGLLKTDRRLAEFMVNPTIKRNDKREILTTSLKKKNYSSMTINLMGVMADNGRLNKVNAVFGAFGKLMSAHRGEVTSIVITAKPLDEGNLKDLKSALQALLKKGEILQLETKVDPSLIGGMVVTIGDKYVDMSMATKIKTYTNLIQQPV